MKSEESLGSKGSRGVGGEWEWVMGNRFVRASVNCIFELGLWPYMLVLGWPVVRCVFTSCF